MRSLLLEGTVLFNRYCIVRLLGKGGFAHTYLIRDRGRFDELCVLKELAPVQTQKLDKAIELFHREAAILYQIEHPHIPRFRAFLEDYDDEGPRLFFVQDYVVGKTYRQLLQERKLAGQMFSEAEVRTLLVKMLPVLEYLHNQGIIHRDLTPENLIFRESDQQPIVIDFGIVKEIVARWQEPDSLNGGYTRVGKLGFAPIEQLQTGRVYPSSDLYALGVTAIVLLTGQEPSALFEDHTANWRWQNLTTVTPAFAQILDRMLSYRLSDRYGSASEVLSAIQALPRLESKTVSTLQPLLTVVQSSEQPGAETLINSAIHSIHKPALFQQFQRLLRSQLRLKAPSWSLRLVLGFLLTGLLASAVWSLGTLLKPLQRSATNLSSLTPSPSPSTPQPLTYRRVITLDANGQTTVNDLVRQHQTLLYRLAIPTGHPRLKLTLANASGIDLNLLSPKTAVLSGTRQGTTERFKLPSPGDYQIRLRTKPGVIEQSFRLTVVLEVASLAIPAPVPVPIPVRTPTSKSIQPYNPPPKPKQKVNFVRQRPKKTVLPQRTRLAQPIVKPTAAKITVTCGPKDAIFIVEKVPPGCRVR